MKSRISPRRSDYDYASAGGYFITICTAGRQHYFGEIANSDMQLNDL
jgi:putative transposase